MDYYCQLIDIPTTNLHYISIRSAPIVKIMEGQTTARAFLCARSEKVGDAIFLSRKGKKKKKNQSLSL